MGMSGTERLRRLLDERGVEWWQSANTLGCVFTRWHSPLFGDEVCAMENGEEGLVLFDHFVTPEQAIAATLGRGTCHEVVDKSVSWYMTVCSECGYTLAVEQYGPSNFCPQCGRRIVDATTNDVESNQMELGVDA